ncbi:hypothetical protein H671_6g16027 [Cricetulus griseus]|nr:hypothetical protein H671_6g16027 [Cricetulus griseus]
MHRGTFLVSSNKQRDRPAAGPTPFPPRRLMDTEEASSQSVTRLVTEQPCHSSQLVQSIPDHGQDDSGIDFPLVAWDNGMVQLRVV